MASGARKIAAAVIAAVAVASALFMTSSVWGARSANFGTGMALAYAAILATSLVGTLGAGAPKAITFLGLASAALGLVLSLAIDLAPATIAADGLAGACVVTCQFAVARLPRWTRPFSGFVVACVLGLTAIVMLGASGQDRAMRGDVFLVLIVLMFLVAVLLGLVHWLSRPPTEPR